MRNFFVQICVCLLACIPALSQERVQLKLDASEAEAALTILDKLAASAPITESDWKHLFATEPYQRLKAREAYMNRAFTDDDFKRYIMSEDLAARRVALRRTLDTWMKSNLQRGADRILPYLPPTARIRASVYPVIKPKSNSFVWDLEKDPAIFLYLDPEKSQSEFENTVAHESHHIGYADAEHQYEAKIASLPPNARKAAQWMGAFGEGLAVLAAAGSADVHPLRDFPADQRARWDEDMKSSGDELIQVNQFFLDVVNGGFARPEVADHVGFIFFGYRGPWYVVGYKMGRLIEKKYGRTALVQCMSDPRMLLAKYNEAAEIENKSAIQKLPLWSPEVLTAVGVESKLPR